ncbi:hypothetical protein NOX90_00330 [Wolbachia endosymbiont of Anurida maritima]|uniref:hypothetical protein n=1 Tax=Wolbachia endosymbiont of Anurida maritima TaxID=2850562 RepID=UPI0035CFBD1B
MSDDLVFKILSKFEPKFRNKNLADDQVIHAKSLYGVVDKVVIDLNKNFVPVLDEKFNDLINTIGNIDKQGSLKEQIQSLRTDLDALKTSKVVDPNNEDSWEAPQLKGADDEFIII